jgi:ElaB/YqjD/DUF883 family membrane-anchored ribosome-binding protein
MKEAVKTASAGLRAGRERFVRWFGRTCALSARNPSRTACRLASRRFFRYDSRVALPEGSKSMSEVNKERLMSDIKTVLADAEDLLKQAASATGERASELRETALSRLKQAKEKAADVQVVVVEKGKKAARATDDYVHEHPWASIGIAAGVGVVVGLLINRK